MHLDEEKKDWLTVDYVDSLTRKRIWLTGSFDVPEAEQTIRIDGKLYGVDEVRPSFNDRTVVTIGLTELIDVGQD